MKKLLLLFLGILSLGSLFQACSDSKTYAEMLEDERKAIRKFISKHDIKNVISQEEFEKDTITDYENNQYVLLNNGVYLQIISRGEGDTIASRNKVTIRMIEYNIMYEIDSKVSGDTISNIDEPTVADLFVYLPTVSSVPFVEGWFPYVYNNVFYTSGLDVPQGIISVIPYLKDRAHFKLIVPSKSGHTYAMQYVYPFYYEVRKLQIY